ncbi:class I SAM-dependent methyltransferase [Glutamicibacter nicotianae]|uniref:class I SAM-dependent methyltransferase n=1 Tax=Glutamicibacter nicotianae TaxID=37929 RepID=UPI001956CE02|nr:class I SAM-dependent methyltransferase [Glutamicibacter nicotianae]MBM7768366.1 2-polyprenyl-3-methyl-5-hydroxy-6-metoxy-1,4-benzoquinol methylase [Glutamicibacter nicotianae]
MTAPEENLWLATVRKNPDHSQNFAQRWRTLAAEGQDIFGEARAVDAMVARGSRILDAGCGTGRIGGWLSEQGHHVVGVDLDPHLIEVARMEYPNAQWQVGNLAEFTVADEAGEKQEFDLIVSAGNVVTFLSESERLPSLQQLREHLASDGRMIIGFGSGRGYEFVDFESDAIEAGLVIRQRYSTWNFHLPADDFLVAVLGRK